MPPGLARPPSEAYSEGRCIGGAPALFPRLPRAHALGAAVPAGEWCNGNTAVFGTVILGSSPSSPATDFQRLSRHPSLSGARILQHVLQLSLSVRSLRRNRRVRG